MRIEVLANELRSQLRWYGSVVSSMLHHKTPEEKEFHSPIISKELQNHRIIAMIVTLF